MGLGDGSGVGLGDGSGVGLGDGSGVGSGVGSGIGSGIGSGDGSGVRIGDGSGVSIGDGSGVRIGDGSGVSIGDASGAGLVSAGGVGVGFDPLFRNEPTKAQEPKPVKMTKPAPRPIAAIGLSHKDPLSGLITGSGWFCGWELLAIGSGRLPTATVATCETLDDIGG